MDLHTDTFDDKCLKIESCAEKDMFLAVTLPNGEKYEYVEPRRYFPIARKNEFISLRQIDEKEGTENEICVIDNINELDEASQIALNKALDYFYLVPKIYKITRTKDLNITIHWDVETNRGKYGFDISDPYSHIRQLTDNHIMVRDLNDNKYEIEDIRLLPKESMREIIKYL